jgi:hypothetical protein
LKKIFPKNALFYSTLYNPNFSLLFADSKLKTDAQNSSIEFYVKPLLDCPDKDVYECIHGTVTSEKQIANENPDGEAQPLWEITDLFGSRIDTK